FRLGASVQRACRDPGRVRACDRRPLPGDPPSELLGPPPHPLRLGLSFPERDRSPGLAPFLSAACRAHEIRGGTPRIGVRRAVCRLSRSPLAAFPVSLLACCQFSIDGWGGFLNYKTPLFKVRPRLMSRKKTAVPAVNLRSTGKVS